MSTSTAFPLVPSRRRCADDGGAVLVEAAMVLPLLMIFLCGVVDFGMAFKQRLTMQGSVRIMARAEAVLGPKPNADDFALASLWAGMSNISSMVSINKVIVYKTDSTGALPSQCDLVGTSPSGAGTTAAGPCNVYEVSQLQAASSGTFVEAGAVACTTGWDRWYCPKNRSNLLTGPPDYLGVYMKCTYTPFTKMFGTNKTMTDQEVVRIEPLAS